MFSLGGRERGGRKGRREGVKMNAKVALNEKPVKTRESRDF